MPNRVVVHAYDLSQGMARAMSMQLMGKQIDAIYHTAIVVYGREFFYGGGIASAPPGQTHFGAPLEVIELGTTEVPEALFLEWLSSNAGRFRAEDYNLLRHNCNTFTDEAARMLVDHLPKTLVELRLSQFNGSGVTAEGARAVLDGALRRLPLARGARSGHEPKIAERSVLVHS